MFEKNNYNNSFFKDFLRNEKINFIILPFKFDVLALFKGHFDITYLQYDGIYDSKRTQKTQKLIFFLRLH